jgi:hypothetical protein
VRARERPRADALAELPPELRMFSDESRADGRGAGMDAFPDRAAWLAARRAWEAEQGMTAAQWWDELNREIIRAGLCLDDLNKEFSRYLVEEDDFEDPREPRTPASGLARA